MSHVESRHKQAFDRNLKNNARRLAGRHQARRVDMMNSGFCLVAATARASRGGARVCSARANEAGRGMRPGWDQSRAPPPRGSVGFFVLPWSNSWPSGEELFVLRACLPSMQSRWRYASTARPLTKYTQRGASPAQSRRTDRLRLTGPNAPDGKRPTGNCQRLLHQTVVFHSSTVRALTASPSNSGK
jgi:hypothetical protein